MSFFQFSISSRFAETEEKTENSSICRSSRSYCKSRADLGVWKGEWRCEITFNIKKVSSQTALVFDLVLQSDRIFLHSSPEILLYILCFQRICLEASLERPGSGFVFHSSTTTTTTMENDDDISVKQKWKIGHRFPPNRGGKNWSIAGIPPQNQKKFLCKSGGGGLEDDCRKSVGLEICLSQ